MHHHANGYFDLFTTTGYQIVNPLTEAISILSWKYKRFTSFYHVLAISLEQKVSFFQWNMGNSQTDRTSPVLPLLILLLWSMFQNSVLHI